MGVSKDQDVGIIPFIESNLSFTVYIGAAMKSKNGTMRHTLSALPISFAYFINLLDGGRCDFQVLAQRKGLGPWRNIFDLSFVVLHHFDHGHGYPWSPPESHFHLFQCLSPQIRGSS